MNWLRRFEIQEILLFLLWCHAQFSSPASTRSTHNSQQPSLFSFQFGAHDSQQPSFQLAPRSATQPGSKFSAFDSNREIRQQPTIKFSAFDPKRWHVPLMFGRAFKTANFNAGLTMNWLRRLEILENSSSSFAQFSSPASTRSTHNSQQPSLFSFQFESHDSQQPSFQLSHRSATQPTTKFPALNPNREMGCPSSTCEQSF